jgi:adenylate cyclase
LKENGLLQPRRLQASILFVDIRDFSRMASHMEPGELADMMNRHYFNPLDQIVYDSGGTLDKHIGDGIMALFGAPISYEDDALRAVRCAVRMLEETKRINVDFGEQGAFSIGIRIANGVRHGRAFRIVEEEGIHCVRKRSTWPPAWKILPLGKVHRWR